MPGAAAAGGKYVIGLELDHGPNHHPERRKRLFKGMELGQQGRVDPAPVLYPGQGHTKGLDDVIGRHGKVRGPLLHHLQHGKQHLRTPPLGDVRPGGMRRP